MTTLEKLAKADKTNFVTKKDGNLTSLAIDAITSFRGGVFRPNYTSGSGRYTINLSNDRVKVIASLLGYKIKEGNDSPRGGQTGNYIKLSKVATNNILSLIND